MKLVWLHLLKQVHEMRAASRTARALFSKFTHHSLVLRKCTDGSVHIFALLWHYNLFHEENWTRSGDDMATP